MRILQAVMKKSQYSVAVRLAMSKQAPIAPLACAGMDSYARAYPFAVKLHLLREVEEFQALLVGCSYLLTGRTGSDLLSHQCGQGNLSSLSEGLSLVPLGLEAQASGAPNVSMEKAKLLWVTQDSNSAILELQKSLLTMPKRVDYSTEIANLMRSRLKNLPTYKWLTLVSRVCHKNEETVRIVKDIITSVLLQFPQQGLSVMAGVSKSNVPASMEAAAEILQAARNQSGRVHLFLQFASLTDDFSKLCFLDGNEPKLASRICHRKQYRLLKTSSVLLYA
ncbi:unnamed protein product [Thlaspi arvense]|uniref:Serine/threonine-protein kinase ATR-like HEAT repeats domain-containing protein n=1 Tax=Thlaspi arvense TaxID=13288 RepID=A0AAU9T5L4_THLAR|nr:unnamed protein product [Thlaspi arvense]